MKILPLSTPILKKGDNLIDILVQKGNLEDEDILVLSSKAVATVEGAEIDLSKISPSEEAKEWAQKAGSSAEFRQAVIDETKRLNGILITHSPVAQLSEVKPQGMTDGKILAINAGLDQSNIQEGFAIGWPVDPVLSAKKIKEELEEKTGKRLAVIISDSCCRPRRLGVTAIALTVAGMNPMRSLIGTSDLYDKKLKMTQEAVADQLATAANFVMGNANEAVPAAIIRDHEVELTEFCGWVPGIDPKEDIFGEKL